MYTACNVCKGSLNLYLSLPVENGYRIADDIFKRIFVNEKFYISIQISLKFVRKVPIANNQDLFK